MAFAYICGPLNHWMNGIQIFWEHSPLWLLVFFLLAFGISWWQYSRKDTWPGPVRWTLLGIRTLLYFLIMAFFLNPMVRNFKKAVLPPVTVLLVDNSQSVSLGSSPDSLKILRENLKVLKENLTSKGVQVVFTDLKKDLVSDSGLVFQDNQTHLESALERIKEQFQNQNLSQVILASDGIFNTGQDPSQLQYPFRVQTIRLGNPRPRKDLQIIGLRHNQVSYSGNIFPVVAQIKGRKLTGSSVTVELMEKGKLLQSQTLTIQPNELAEAAFQLKAETKGIHQYMVNVKPVEGELTLLNNRKSFYVEVVDSKQKVLLLASAPHPDIKAIRAALGTLEQLELTTIVGGKDDYKPGSYNLIILHQVPDRWGTFAEPVSQFLKGNTPVWLITGINFDQNRLRKEASEWMNLQGYGSGTDEVSGKYNSDFQRIIFEDSWKKTIEGLPPINSPVSIWNMKGPSEIILQQRLGKAITPNPLMAISLNGALKRAVFWGDGIWLWRMNEYALQQKTEAVDNLIQKTVQLLISSEKKQRLRVFPARQEWIAGEQPEFFSKTFNQVFEPIFDQKIDLEIRNRDGKRYSYSFFNHSSQSGYRVESLPEGQYQFVASCTLNGKKETDSGEFIVKANDLESQDLEANHSLLERLATNHGGKSVFVAQMNQLLNGSEEDKPLIEFTDWDENLLSKTWILLVLIGLACTEWFIRKWFGQL